MRAATLVALLLLVGALVGGVWWWTAGRVEDPSRRSGEPAVAPPSEARIDAESAPSPPPAGSIEAQRTPSAAAPVEPAPASGTSRLRSVRVHVVDRDTKAEIGDVTVIRTSSTPPAVEHAASPVTVTPGPRLNPIEPRESFWFTAPGYVRNSTSIDFRDTKDRTVELYPCGVLLVTIRGELPKTTPPPPPRKPKPVVDFKTGTLQRSQREPRIQLRHEEVFSGMFVDRPLALGETRIDEITPGTLTVSVEIGGAPPIVLDSKTVRVAAGETARVELVLAPFAMPVAAPLAGTLQVPLGWPDKKLGLSFLPRGIPGAISEDGIELDATDLAPIPGRSGAYRWEAGDVLPGRYVIAIKGTSTTTLVDVPPTGATDVALVASAHAQLRVRVVSVTDGSPVKLTWLDWTPECRDGGAAVSPILLLYDEATRTFNSRVPVGRGVLESFGADLWALDDAAPVEIFPGEQKLVARVHPIGGASLALTSEGKPVELAQRLVDSIAVTPVGGAGRCFWKKLRDARPAFAVDPPGCYTVTLPAIPGYEPVAPFEVDFVVGTFAKVPVELRRE